MSRLDKIDKLLRLSENNPDKSEAESALRKAGELMRDYIDHPDNPLQVDRARLEQLEKRERRVERFCSGCAREKPHHAEGCLSHQLEKRVGFASAISCFGCSGIIILWLIGAAADLFLRFFG